MPSCKWPCWATFPSGDKMGATVTFPPIWHVVVAVLVVLIAVVSGTSVIWTYLYYKLEFIPKLAKATERKRVES
jgi:hypothetical protein